MMVEDDIRKRIDEAILIYSKEHDERLPSRIQVKAENRVKLQNMSTYYWAGCYIPLEYIDKIDDIVGVRCIPSSL